jgi:hypothetical protein
MPNVTLTQAGTPTTTPGTLTFRDIAIRSLRKIGFGEDTPTAKQLEDARAEANSMLDAWNAERFAIYTVNPQTFAITPNKQTYTVGAGGDWNVTRPLKVEAAYLNIIGAGGTSGNLDIPLQVDTDEQYAAIPLKSLTSTLPREIYYSPDYPIGTAFLWPVPTVANNVTLWLRTQLTQFASVNDPFAMPPAYEDAVCYHLAIRLAPEYGKEASATVVQLAKLAKANLKRANAPDIRMSCDPAVSGNAGIWDWRTGDYIR